MRLSKMNKEVVSIDSQQICTLIHPEAPAQITHIFMPSSSCPLHPSAYIPILSHHWSVLTPLHRKHCTTNSHWLDVRSVVSVSVVTRTEWYKSSIVTNGSQWMVWSRGGGRKVVDCWVTEGWFSPLKEVLGWLLGSGE